MMLECVCTGSAHLLATLPLVLKKFHVLTADNESSRKADSDA